MEFLKLLLSQAKEESQHAEEVWKRTDLETHGQAAFGKAYQDYEQSLRKVEEIELEILCEEKGIGIDEAIEVMDRMSRAGE